MTGNFFTVILRLIIGVFFLVFCSGVTFAQMGGSVEKTALRNMEKHRWRKAEDKLRKGLERDGEDPSLRYVLSLFYFHSDNPYFQVDSAYHYAITALQDYARAPARVRERLRRMGVDSVALISLRAGIDSAAFQMAMTANTEAAYRDFLSHFPSSVQRDLAASLRDEVAYQEALRENTYHAFHQYLKRYPTAQRSAEARENYDRLLYLEHTRDQRLRSFEKFLSDHPETPYRRQIHKNIFEISTAEGTVESFLAFMSRYPASELVRKAGQMIFHMLAEQDSAAWPAQFLSDSLRHLLALKHSYLVPVLQNNLYGFIDKNGNEVIAPSFSAIHPDYLCGHITGDALILPDRLIGVNGSMIYNGVVEELNDLGVGFLKIATPEGAKVVHKSGFLFKDSVEDARVLSGRYIAVKKDAQWWLYTLSGRLLDEEGWDDIHTIQQVVVFRRNGNAFIARAEVLAKSADGSPLSLSEAFEDVKPWLHGLIWGKAGEYQGVLDQSMRRVIGFDKHVLTQTFFGAAAEGRHGVVLYRPDGNRSSTFDEVKISDPWIGVRKNRSWFLLDPLSLTMSTRAYDSLQIEGPFMVGLTTDRVYVHFAKHVTLTFPMPVRVGFLPGMKSTSFLLVEESRNVKGVFDLWGNKLFSADFDDIQFAGQGIFTVTKNGKKGLLDAEGKMLLKPEFDAIGTVKDDVVSILKDKRFGAFNIWNKKLLKPQYERNVVPYTRSVVSIYKNGLNGFISWDNKPVSEFMFDEIRYWDDTLALVRQGALWSFYDILSRKPAETNLRKVILVQNTGEEKVAIIQKGHNFGVVSNLRNVFIPITFSDIVNLGSAEEPLYFTEKHIREAGLHIVIYYDRFGNLLRQQIYDNAADYDKIYCSDH
jgi:tetratricopeptide (TPR) repeat protein